MSLNMSLSMNVKSSIFRNSNRAASACLCITPCVSRDMARSTGQEGWLALSTPGREVTGGWVAPWGAAASEVSICLWVGIDT